MKKLLSKRIKIVIIVVVAITSLFASLFFSYSSFYHVIQNPYIRDTYIGKSMIRSKIKKYLREEENVRSFEFIEVGELDSVCSPRYYLGSLTMICSEHLAKLSEMLLEAAEMQRYSDKKAINLYKKAILFGNQLDSIVGEKRKKIALGQNNATCCKATYKVNGVVRENTFYFHLEADKGVSYTDKQIREDEYNITDCMRMRNRYVWEAKMDIAEIKTGKILY